MPCPNLGKAQKEKISIPRFMICGFDKSLKFEEQFPFPSVENYLLIILSETLSQFPPNPPPPTIYCPTLSPRAYRS